MIPYGRQEISDEDVNAVLEALRSDFLTQGPKVPLFEKAVADYCGSKYGVAVNSATSALHIACLSLELKKNDFFWTVPNSFVASANCGLYCGAKVDFVDIDKKTYNISLKKLEEKLKIAKKKNKLPKILISVHFGGQSTDQHEIWKLSKKYNFSIIEDASHSLGAKHRGRKVGNCRWSDITVFSFHPVKPITTCEGGMALTNNKTLYDFLIKFRSHGITKDLSKLNPK